MPMMWAWTPAEREIEALSEELENAETPQERHALEELIRDIERDLGEQERWEEEGEQRGWI